MKTATRSRPPRGGNSVPRSPRPLPSGRPARPLPRAAAGSAYRNGFLTGMGAGMTVAMVLVAVALFTGVGAKTSLAPRTSPAGQASTSGHQHDPAAAADQGSQADAAAADIKASARHLGNLQVLVEADVVSRQSHAALVKADVAATLDMTEMPGSHVKHVALKDVDGRPGHYAGIVEVPMVGQWDVKIRSSSPLVGETHQFIDIGTVSPQRSGLPRVPASP